MPNCNDMRKEKNFPKFNIDSFCAPNLEIAFEKIDKKVKQPVKEPMQIFESLTYDSYCDSSRFLNLKDNSIE